MKPTGKIKGLETYKRIGSRTHASSHPNSIPPLSGDSLTTSHFRWIHQEVWGAEETTWFLAKRQATSPPFDKRTPYVVCRRDPAPVVVGRYILTNGLATGSKITTPPACENQHKDKDSATPFGETRLGWCEIVCFAKKFRTYELLLGGLHTHPSSFGDDTGTVTDRAVHLDAIGLLVSGVMLMANPDLVRLAYADEASRKTVASTDWHKKYPQAEVWTPNHMPAQASGRYHNFVHLQPVEWWDQEPGKTLKNTLDYINKRRSRHEKAQRMSETSRGFFRRNKKPS